ncbi:MAG: hypothetical protein H6Q15_448 [Bacteroidetes bacterium]|nr:hypothetical protein [Bacteroidota bacterium]
MQLVTLSTDWGNSDHYVGAVKAKLYSIIEDCHVVDITHNIDKFNIPSAAFIVKNACLGFPKGTIHIIDVDCAESSENLHVLIKWNDQFFICTDNGLPNLVFDTLNDVRIYGLSVFQDSNFYTFSAFNLFCKVASEIAKGEPVEDLGYEIQDFYRKGSQIKPAYIFGSISCTVFHVDSYGNAFLNITINDFLDILKDRKFLIEIEKFKIEKISTSYIDVRINNPLLTVSSTGYLQIAINKANASELLGYRIGTPVTIKIIE